MVCVWLHRVALYVVECAVSERVRSRVWRGEVGGWVVAFYEES
jgi:hypothetical protein